MIRTEIFDAPAWNRSEIRRYARISGAEGFDHLIDACIKESESVLSYRVCYTILPVNRTDEGLWLGTIKESSKTIEKAIRNAREVVLFAATVGAPFDLLIRRYGMAEPSKALILQAIGAERAESLCDAFCKMISKELSADGKHLTKRVSPGYGDISLELQRDIFKVLDCPRKIGLTLDESLLMSPSKSVTAIVGIMDHCTDNNDPCETCDKKDCVYRK